VKALKGSRMGLGLLGIVERSGTSNQTNPISSSSSSFFFF
jgi:hypothetical protein